MPYPKITDEQIDIRLKLGAELIESGITGIDTTND